MKVKLLVLLGMMAVSCCDSSNSNKSVPFPTEGNNSVTVQNENFDIKRKWKQDIMTGSYIMVEIEVDGCRYFILEGYGETLQMVHKENCSNLIHIE